MLSEKIIKVEELVSELYGPNCSQESLQYCQDVQNKYIENNNRFEDLFQSLINTRIPHFKFWIIDTLIKIINQLFHLKPYNYKEQILYLSHYRDLKLFHSKTMQVRHYHLLKLL